MKKNSDAILIEKTGKIAVSVIICTHNPRREYLFRTLEALRCQTLSFDHWELLIIDNGSIPNVVPDLSWHPRAHLHREETIGLTHARMFGIRHSSADLLVFVDDDNLLAADYLTRAVEIQLDWPVLGTWGGQIIPEFEISPPEWIRPYWSALALREVPRDQWSNLSGAAASEPYGAGLCVRRHVVEHYVQVLQSDIRRRGLGRKGGSLISGEDSDIVWTSCDLGLGNGVFTRLKLTHLIPAARLEESYLLRLVEALSYSKVLLDSIHGHVHNRPSRSQMLFDFYRHLCLDARERRFQAAKVRGREAALADIEG